MPTNNSALSDAVKARMGEQGWSQATVITQGGPSSTSLTKILSGQGNLSPKLLAQLDTGLQWEPGTSARILTGAPASGGSSPTLTITMNVRPAEAGTETIVEVEGLPTALFRANLPSDATQEEANLVTSTVLALVRGATTPAGLDKTRLAEVASQHIVGAVADLTEIPSLAEARARQAATRDLDDTTLSSAARHGPEAYKHLSPEPEDESQDPGDEPC